MRKVISFFVASALMVLGVYLIGREALVLFGMHIGGSDSGSSNGVILSPKFLYVAPFLVAVSGYWLWEDYIAPVWRSKQSDQKQKGLR